MVRRHVSDEMLALYALAWNLTTRTHAGRLRGKRPYDILGVDIGQARRTWVDLILERAERPSAAA
jgi:hypothetical protein